MKYQPWIQSDTWEKNDPKLMEISKQTIRLFHTSLLVKTISLELPGIIMVRGPRQVGKSTFLRELVQKAFREEHAPEDVVFYDAEGFENRYYLQSEITHWQPRPKPPKRKR